MRALDSKRALDCVGISRKWPDLVLGKTDCFCLLKLMPLTSLAHLEVYLRTSVSAVGNTFKIFYQTDVDIFFPFLSLLSILFLLNERESGGKHDRGESMHTHRPTEVNQSGQKFQCFF